MPLIAAAIIVVTKSEFNLDTQTGTQNMAHPQHIDRLLQSWEFDPVGVNARVVRGGDGRKVIQMRIDMGVLQLETAGRPDGARPEGFETYYDYLMSQVLVEGDEYVLTEPDCIEVDREFVQFYHRRICWLQLNEFERAVEDADHTLGLMDLCRQHSPDEHWTLSHEQYRRFVLFHRTQAAALAQLNSGDGPEAAIHEINQGVDSINAFLEEFEVEDFEDDELLERLKEMREDLRQRYEVGRTLHEQLADAVASEQYELAARLRTLSRRMVGTES